MKTIAISRFGGPEVLKLIEVPEPIPAAGEALVALEYAGVNFIDVYMRSGHYARSRTYQTPLPMTIGMEGGGTVAALGEGVTEVAVGDRVAYCIVRGSYAQSAAVPAWRLVKIPPQIPTPAATALMLQGLTAHYLDRKSTRLNSSHRCISYAVFCLKKKTKK